MSVESLFQKKLRHTHSTQLGEYGSLIRVLHYLLPGNNAALQVFPLHENKKWNKTRNTSFVVERIQTAKLFGQFR